MTHSFIFKSNCTKRFNYKLQKLNAKKSTVKNVDLSRITHIVCDYYQMKVESLKLKTRKHEFVKVRQICHYFAKKYTKLSFAKIGMEISSKNHATIIHSIKVVNNHIFSDKDFANDINILEKKISYN